MSDKQYNFFAKTVLPLLLIMLSSCGQQDATDKNYPEGKNIEHSFRLQNVTGRAIPKAIVSFYTPIANSSYQKALSVEASGLAGKPKKQADGLGNQLLSYELNDIPPGFTATLRINSRVGVAQDAVALSTEEITPYLQTPATFSFALDLPEGITAADKIKPLSEAVSQALDNSQLTETNDTTTEALDHDLVAEAVETETHLPADPCLIKALHFIYAARTLDIPARLVVGLYADGDSNQLQCWPEVFQEQRWLIVNQQNHNIATDSTQYLALRVIEASETSEANTVGTLEQLLYTGYGLQIDLLVNNH